jgi:ribonuclease P protein component
VRNRLRRRLREAARLRLEQLSPECLVVINPRRKALKAPFAELQKEIEALFRRCNAQS